MMNSKTFMNISREECLKVYIDMIENSEKNWSSAKILSSNKDYGSAVSMSIISVEELVKALIIVLDGRGFDFRKIRGIEKFFRNHEIRYVIAYFMFVASLIGEEFMFLLKSIINNPEKLNQFVKNMQADENFICKNYRIYFLRKVVLIKQELNWFSKVDLFRQEGFYCDYNENLKTPIKISEKEFKEVQRRLSKVREVGFFIINEFFKPKNGSDKQIQDLKNKFKEGKFYDKIGITLGELKKSKKKPFDALMDAFKN